MKPAPSKAVCILGMHRSGTSSLAGCLEELGLFLGEVVNAAPHNRKGNKENVPLRHINDAVLAHNGGGWDDPPSQLSWTEDLCQRRDEHVATYDGIGLWGFKDPRSVLTLPFWQEALPDMKLIGTFRKPEMVVASIKRRPGLAPKTSALELWKAYNRKLLSYAEKYDMPLVCFDWPKERYLRAIEKFAAGFGLTRSDQHKDSFYEETLRHRESPPQDAQHSDSEAEEIYARLMDIAEVNTPAVQAVSGTTTPKLSIVVIFHNMTREAERTLKSMSVPYQTNIAPDDYEIIAIDNGSADPLDPDAITKIAPNIRYYKHETTSVSPALAVNFGASKARGEFIAVIVDGARMSSPGLLSETLKAVTQKDKPFVCALSWHLGPDVQNVSMLNGYDQTEEDRLLASIDWYDNGYRLFEISTIAQSSGVGFGGGMPTECSYFAMQRGLFKEIGGFDVRFQAPGGGLINHDFLLRSLDIPGVEPVVILGEGVFHQYHGGVATNVPMVKHPYGFFKDEYAAIRGVQFEKRPAVQPSYVGKMHAAAMPFAHKDFDGAADAD